MGSHRKRNKGTGIPNRWLNYDAVGSDIQGTRFVPFKTPLDERFFKDNRNLTSEDYFGVQTLISKAQQVEKKIGLVIDLTNTDRYYTKSKWKDYDIEYFKITCPGHEVNKREDIVNIFISKVEEYCARFQDDSLIGVHCTHGLNRTGYLICRYLIDKMDWEPGKAISTFEFYRGHPIERRQYKESLYTAYKRKQAQQNDEVQKADAQISITRVDEEVEQKDEKVEEVKNNKEKPAKMWTGGPPDLDDIPTTSVSTTIPIQPTVEDIPIPPFVDELTDPIPAKRSRI